MNGTPCAAADMPRAAVVRRGLLLGWLTVAWMTVEGTVALGSGVAAHSLTLSAFGFESLIEPPVMVGIRQ
jgi:hypothetical protein